MTQSNDDGSWKPAEWQPSDAGASAYDAAADKVDQVAGEVQSDFQQTTDSFSSNQADTAAPSSDQQAGDFSQPSAPSFGQPAGDFSQPSAPSFGQPAGDFSQSTTSSYGQPATDYSQPAASSFDQPIGQTSAPGFGAQAQSQPSAGYAQPAGGSYGQPAPGYADPSAANYGAGAYSQPSAPNYGDHQVQGYAPAYASAPYGVRQEHPQAQTVLILGILGLFTTITAFIGWYLGGKAMNEIKNGAPYNPGGSLKIGYIISKVISIFTIVVFVLAILAGIIGAFAAASS